MTNWTLRYLELARQVGLWSKDPSSQLGAVVVGDKKQILSQGYNGFPRGINDDDRLLDREKKYPRIVHAEMNCIYNACLNGVSLNNGDMYIHGLPVCHNCVPGIIQVGIARVYMAMPVNEPERTKKWNDSWMLSKEMLTEAGVVYQAYGYESGSDSWLDSAGLTESNWRELKDADRWDYSLRRAKPVG